MRRLLSSLILPRLSAATMALASPALASASVPPVPPQSGVLAGLRQYIAAFQPVTGETSMLAYARREALDWTAFQNLWASQLTDGGQRFVDWRGHSGTPDGSVFTILRAGLYATASGNLLVVNREWCRAGQCQARTVFAWQDGQTLRAVKDSAVIPLIRDADFYPGAVPACLKGAVLDVSYLPSRSTQTLAAMAVVPPASLKTCAASGVDAGAATRPLQLNWTAGVGKFRRGW